MPIHSLLDSLVAEQVHLFQHYQIGFKYSVSQIPMTNNSLPNFVIHPFAEIRLICLSLKSILYRLQSQIGL